MLMSTTEWIVIGHLAICHPVEVVQAEQHQREGNVQNLSFLLFTFSLPSPDRTTPNSVSSKPCRPHESQK
jgi:hypothetical protein